MYLTRSLKMVTTSTINPNDRPCVLCGHLSSNRKRYQLAGGKLFYSGKFKNTFFFPLENFVNTYARLTLSSFRMSARKEQS